MNKLRQLFLGASVALIATGTAQAQALTGTLARIKETGEIRVGHRDVSVPFSYLTDDGKPIPRNVIRLVTCRYNGVEVFRAEPSSGIAANPLFTFFVTARDSGELVFDWVDDAGERASERATISVANGVVAAGLATTVLPASSAGGSLKHIRMIGKFHGMIAPTTPSGL